MKTKLPLATARQPCSQDFSLQHVMDGKSPSHFLNGKALGTKNRSFSTVYFSSKSYLFFCNSVKIGQNFQKEVFFERSIFANIAAYQLNNLN